MRPLARLARQDPVSPPANQISDALMHVAIGAIIGAIGAAMISIFLLLR